MTDFPVNKYRLIGKSQRWTYNGGCEFEWHFHKGKVEWHHPLQDNLDIGMYLCEGHHSLLQGRKRLYNGESDNMPLSEILELLKDQERRVVVRAGLDSKNINKH